MPRDPRHDILFEPVQIGPKTLRNRFYQVPHCTGFGSEKPGSQARFRGMKAEGGWAAVCTEEALVSPDSDYWPVVSQRVWDEDDVRNLALMADEAHQHGSLAGVELTHGGGHGTNRESRWPAIAPSQVASDYYSSVVPKAMEAEDIERVRDDWVRAAKLVRDAGLDILYVYGGHSYLPLQFLSPFYNKRTDAYGGSLENRARFWLETLEAVREAVGDDCAIAVRLCVEALGPAGVELEEGLAFVRLADHLVDLWDVNVGSIIEWSKDSGASRFFQEGYQLEWTGRVREATAKPIVGVGRLTNPDRMAEIIRSGAWDLIGAARPSIADPFLPKKVEEGRYGEVRECIGCNICVMKAEWGNHIGCTQNATAGEEYRRGWHPERFEPAENRDRDVLVVGSGPAGMECAIVLGKRGFRRVHLVEAEAEIGGITRWVPKLPGLGEWGRVLNWRTVQLGNLDNVEVITGARLSAQDVREYGAEIVVVATGARWATDGLNFVTHEPIPGADASLAHVLTPEQVMLEGKDVPGERVLVYDADGYFMASGLAEKLAAEGRIGRAGHPARANRAHVRRDARGPAPAPTSALGRRPRPDRHDGDRDRAGPRQRHRRVRRARRAGGRRGRARHPAPLRRRALPRAEGGRGHARRRGHRGALPDWRLRRAADHRGGDLRRAPARPRDRLGEPVPPAPVHARAPRAPVGDDGLVAAVRTDFPRRVREIEHTWLHLSDGTRLAARIWLPEDAEADPVPAILEYLPYRKTDGTALRDSQRQPYLAGFGYAAVRVDMRGTGDSDGVITDEYTQQEQDDAVEILAWIAAQPWCDGKLGMWGISWGGFNSLQIAARRPPGLGAIMTLCSTDDRYADDVHYRGGCVLALDMLHWASSMLTWNARPPDPRLYGDGWREEWLRRLDSISTWIEPWLAHQRRDAYWKHGSVCEDYSAIECPVYAVGGFADGYTNAVPRLLEGLSVPRKGLIGPWAHAFPDDASPGPSIGFLQECVRWFDHWLKGIDTGLLDEPMLRVWLQDSVEPQPSYEVRPGRWVAEPAWPSPNVTSRVWELPLDEPRELLGVQSCGTEAGAWTAEGQSADLAGDQRPDDAVSLTFDSDPMSEPLELVGLPEATLELAVDRPSALVVVRLCDIAPDGTSALLTRGLLNLTHRESHEQVEPLEPGRRYEVRVPLDVTASSIPAGHRLRVAVSPTYWPWAWPSPEPVLLTLFSGRIDLPERTPSAEDTGLPEFGPPEHSERLELETVAGSAEGRTIRRELATGLVEQVFDWDLGGSVRFVDIDLASSDTSHTVFSIREDDPLSAEVRFHATSGMGRGEWSMRSEVTSAMTSDAEAFHVTTMLEVYERSARIFARTWTHRFPREGV